MSKFIKPALAAFLALGVLMTGCSQAEDAAKTVDQAKDKAAETADKAKSTATDLVALKDGLGNLKTGADKTLAAVQSGDFATAKTEVTKLQDSWKTIADQVKTKSPEASTKIETGLADLQKGLSADSPNKDSLVKTIKDLVTNITGVSPV